VKQKFIQIWNREPSRVLVISTGIVAVVYWTLLQRHYYQDLNYTFVIAGALMHGHLGTTIHPSWLNELVPSRGDEYFSVFPLGAVLSVLPASWLVEMGWLGAYPVNLVVTLVAAGCFSCAYLMTGLRGDFSLLKRLLLAGWLVFGTWFITNLLFAGAWQIALGFAVLGQLGALYFCAVRRRPLVAGICLALAIGNRTETILAAPALATLMLQPHWQGRGRRQLAKVWRASRRQLLLFFLAPAILILLTFAYNQARFGSPLDFGYAHIPGVLSEPWYQHGIFSVYAIPGNAYAMLWQHWHWRISGPPLVPDGFGGSILLASPFLLLLLRRPRGNRLRSDLAVVTLAALTIALWLHGNAGGWQLSYRYAMILLPWFLLLFIEWLPSRVTKTEAALWGLSVLINAYATYLFMWTNWVR
jgi:hypothetical protein